VAGGEGKVIRKIANSWAVGRNVGIVCLLDRVRQVVAAAGGDGREAPVLLDELHERDVIAIFMRNVAALGVLGDDDQRDAGTIAEEVDWLNVTGVIVSAALIPGDEDGSVGPESRVGLDLVDDLLGEAFEEIELGGRRVTIVEAAGLDDGDRRQVTGVDVFVELGGVPDVGFAGGLGAHELGLVLEGVTDVAVFIERVRLGGISYIEIPVLAEVLERNVMSDEIVTDALLAGWRNCEGRERRGERAVAVEAGVVVVDEIVVALDAVCFDRAAEGLEVIGYSRYAWLADVTAVDVAAATVAILVVEVVGGGLWVRVLDFVDRRGDGNTAGVGVEDGVAKAEHDVVGTGTAHDGLVEVVADGVLIGELFEVRGVALRHVVEAHGGGAFAGGGVAEGAGLRLAVAAGADGGLNPREEVVQAAAGVVLGGVVGVAVGLLPHLEEAVDGAVGVGVVRHLFAADLEYAFTQAGGVGDAGVDLAARDAGGAGDEELVVAMSEAGVGKLSNLQGCERSTSDALCFRTACQSWRKRTVDALELGAVGEGAGAGGSAVDGRELCREGVVGTRLTIGFYDAFGEEVGDGLAFLWLVSGVDVIKGAVLTDDDDDVLDGSGGCRCGGLGVSGLG